MELDKEVVSKLKGFNKRIFIRIENEGEINNLRMFFLKINENLDFYWKHYGGVIYIRISRHSEGSKGVGFTGQDELNYYLEVYGKNIRVVSLNEFLKLQEKIND